MKKLLALAVYVFAAVSCTTNKEEEGIKQISDRVFSLAEKQFVYLADNLPDDRTPKTVDENGVLVTSDFGWWCSGFFPGSLWLVYEHNGNQEIRDLAEKNTLKLQDILSQHTDHDIGFQINCSYGNAYRITGDESWKPMILASAKQLASRFNPTTGTIKSWDFVNEGRDWQWPVIIDNMMNLELLMNAAKLYSEEELSNVAISHAETTRQNHFREDFTTFHLVDYDTITGNARLHHTVQGLADESAWARGQAWAVYGYTMMARESESSDFLVLAENIARYLVSHLPEDGIPYWDFDSPKIPNDLRDASAGAIMASAFVELSGLTNDKDLSKQLFALAEKQIRTLASPKYLATEGTNAGFLLKHCVGHMPNGTEIDVPLTYADYYFLEALSRLERAYEIELLRQRFSEAALQLERSVKIDYVTERINSLQEDGSWADINYIDTRNVAFQNAQHLSHMVEMSRAYKLEGSPLKGDPFLKECILKAIDFWTANDFICENWWNNEIGTPTALLNILYIMDEDLGEERAEKMLAIAHRANMKAQGARPSGDRMKIASLYTKSMLWQRNVAEVTAMIDFMGNEMKYYDDETFERIQSENPQYFHGGRGLQADLSFHHRDDRVNNTLTYGEGHALAFCEWAANLYDTRFHFKDDAIKLMVDYYLDGMCKQMAFGIQSDPNVMNRDMARPSTGKQLANNSIAETLVKITDYRREEIQNLLDLRAGKNAKVESFAKTFFNTEYFVFQRPEFYTSVRMYSSRNASMEIPYNGEGFTNHYRADGANYLTITGNEYSSIYPTFDFRKVPGTTVLQSAEMPEESKLQQWGVTDFVGGVDNGLYGAVAFDFYSPIDNVSAKKAWFFFDNSYLCLGTAISHKGAGEIATTINQCFLKGDVSNSSEGENIRWVNHDNIGYIFPDGGDIKIQNESVTGSWAKLNRQTTINTEPITRDMFCLYLNHGENPVNADYAYIVVPGVTPEMTKQFASKNNIEIIANNADVQSARDKEKGVAYAVLYNKGHISISENINISCDSPAMILIRYTSNSIEEIYVSDPSHKTSELNIIIDAFGKTATHNIILPTKQLAGSSRPIL